MEDHSELKNEAAFSLCPQCGGTVGSTGSDMLQCLDCGQQIAASGASTDQLASDQTPVDEEAELSGLRIRHIAALRRGAYRARSYCIIGAAVLLVGAAQLIIMSVEMLRASGWHHLLLLVYVAAAIAAMFFAWRLGSRVALLTQELKNPLLTDPLEPPDFSTLSDGSQHVRHLEEM